MRGATPSSASWPSATSSSRISPPGPWSASAFLTTSFAGPTPASSCSRSTASATRAPPRTSSPTARSSKRSPAWPALGGYEGGPPAASTFVYTDYVSAMVGVTLMLAGLRRRAETGEGAYFNVAQAEVALNTMPEAILDSAMNGVLPNKPEDRDPFVAMHGSFRCLGEDDADDDLGGRRRAHRYPLPRTRGGNGTSGLGRRSSLRHRRRKARPRCRNRRPRQTVDAALAEARSSGHPSQPRRPRRRGQRRPRRPRRAAPAGPRLVPASSAIPSSARRGRTPRHSIWKAFPREIRRGAPLWGEHNDYVCRDLIGMTAGDVEHLVERRALV